MQKVKISKIKNVDSTEQNVEGKNVESKECRQPKYKKCQK